MNIYTATEARKNLFKLIDATNHSHEPIILTSKRKNAVLVAEDDWKAIQETLYLMSNQGLWNSILEGKDEKIEDCLPLEDFNWPNV